MRGAKEPGVLSLSLISDFGYFPFSIDILFVFLAGVLKGPPRRLEVVHERHGEGKEGAHAPLVFNKVRTTLHAP